MDDFRKEIILTWFGKSTRPGSLIDGLSKQANSPAISDAENLISCSIAYESYIFSLGVFGPNNTVEINRRKLSSIFQDRFQLKIFSDLYNEKILELKRESNRSPVRDMSGKNSNPIDLPDERNLDRVLELVYRIRSNLLHGGKELSDPRNQILINTAYFVLFEILEFIFKAERLI